MKAKAPNAMLMVLLHYGLIDPSSMVEDVNKIVCPLHADVNASMQVWLLDGRYYCYGCMAHGNEIDLIKGIEGCSSLQASMKLHKIMAGSEEIAVKIKRAPKRTPDELMFEAKRYFFSLPKTDWYEEECSYIKRRGFTPRILNKVGARHNPAGDYELVFPMRDMGKFVGYVCRTSKPEVEAKRKYLYNEGFSRRNTLVGRYDKPWPIIVEGYLDWLKLRQFGIDNTCAILGWRITPEQIDKIKQYTDCVISGLDKTETGVKGTKLLRKHFKVIRMTIPELLKDPGDMDQFDFNFSWQATLAKVRKIAPGMDTNDWRK